MLQTLGLGYRAMCSPFYAASLASYGIYKEARMNYLLFFLTLHSINNSVLEPFEYA